MIRLNNVTIKQKNNLLLDNVTNTIVKGKTLIIGENGCGKTTLLKCIIDNKFSSGKVDLDFSNKEFSVSFQNNNLINTYSVINMIAYHLWLNQVKLNDEFINSLLDKWNMQYLKTSNISKLSGGEAKKVSLIMSMLLQRECWVLDEPTNSLDNTSKETLNDITKQYEKNILCITHDQYVVDNFDFDNMVIIKNKTLYVVKNFKDIKFIEYVNSENKKLVQIYSKEVFDEINNKYIVLSVNQSINYFIEFAETIGVDHVN